MDKVLKLICISMILNIVPNSLKALHIIGGEVTYTCKGMDIAKKNVTYEVVFTMYRDSKSNGAQLDGLADFGIYKKSTDGTRWIYFTTVNNIRVREIEDVSIVLSNPCIIIPLNVGVQKGTYTFEVTLPIIDQSYYISYQRCCRNTTILNLRNPGDAGAAFTCEITSEGQQACNSSPKFNDFPPVVICANKSIDFDHSAVDIDGDSLVYSFCAPLTAGGKEGSDGSGNSNSCFGVTPAPNNCPPPYDEVTFFTPNYSFDNPMGGNPRVQIDSKTGLISGVPTLLGQYVVGVCVQEYRDGKLIGYLKRDFQFNVTSCEDAVKADIKATLENGIEYNVISCGNTELNFVNESTDTRFIKQYYWEFDIKGNKEIYNTRNVKVNFPGLGTYKATMILNKDIEGAEECRDTANIVVNIYPSISADFNYVYDTCVAGPIEFADASFSGAGPILKWDWDFKLSDSQQKNPLFEFENPGDHPVKLIVTDGNNCKDTITKIVNYNPVPSLIVVEPNTFIGCQPATIYFNNLSNPIDDTYDFYWDFGDGGTGSDLSPTHIFNDVGTFDIQLKLVSPIGCITEKIWRNFIKIVESPVAGFSYTPEDPNLYNNTVQFNDASSGAEYVYWKFDDLDNSFLRNPQYTFRDTGIYEILQVVSHTSGCSDTARALIDIDPLVTLFMPNAFTPDNDGLNDIYLPVGNFIGIKDYTMEIYNRWGERIFESTDVTQGWNGSRDNSGIAAPAGVYVYVVHYIDGFDEPKQEKGHVTLLR